MHVHENPRNFFIFHFVQRYFFPYECPCLCSQRPGGIQQEKSEVAQNENRKQLHSFLMHKNIANFETFCWNTLNLLVYQLHDNCGEEKISLL